MGQNQIWLETLQELLVDLVNVTPTFRNFFVDLMACMGFTMDSRFGQYRPLGSFGRIVTFMRDRDDLVSKTQGKRNFRRAGKERRDPHDHSRYRESPREILYKIPGNFARINLNSFSSSRSSLNSPILKPMLIAVFTAECLATNYAMIALPNIKIMDALVFIAAFLFDWTVGVGIAISTWAVYGFVNPYGQAGFPLILFLMMGECFYAIGGASLRKTSVAKQLLAERRLSADFAVIAMFGTAGLALTFAYDVLTNFATYIFVSNSLYQALLIGLVTGAPFAILHELSNFCIFALVSPVAILVAHRFSRIQRGFSRI